MEISMIDNRSWPYGKCIVCRDKEAEGNIEDEGSHLLIACHECWAKISVEEAIDYAEQICLGYLYSDPHPKQNRLKWIGLIIKSKSKVLNELK